VCSEVDDALACTRGRADLAAGIEGVEPFASVASRLRKLGCARRSSCAEVTMWVGDRHAERKEWGSAVAAYERAVAADPSDVPLRRLARAASQAGRHGLALRTLEKVLARTDGDDHAELRRRIAAERDKTVRRLLDR
ncbi:MAG: tetratricopeptide repeat protein, partial [Myxococcota bacterium]